VTACGFAERTRHLIEVRAADRPITTLMTATCADSAATDTLAFTQATANLAANRAALAQTQPELQIGQLPDNVEWVLARDRALTCRDSTGQWFTGCSIPRRAAVEMMRRLDVVGPVACFLAPSHATQIRVALDTLGPEQAIIAIMPEIETLAIMLACESFADDIQQHRLWFTTGENWAQNLKQLFADVPGLCTPTQFIRLPIVEDAVVEQLIPAAQRVFTDAKVERAERMRICRESYRPGSSRICLIGGSQFRLWDDAGATLADLFRESDVQSVDLDDPAQASALVLSRCAHNCGAVVTANVGRADVAGVLSDSLPVITWASDTRMPKPQGAAAIDRVITAHPMLAMRAGWKSNQIIHATWPTACSLADRPAKPRAAELAIIVDTRVIEIPSDLSEYSSHRVLWELIATNLHRDPFVLTDDIEAFLTHRMRKLDIAPESVSPARFINDLIIPAYQQSLARLLLRNQLPLKLYGKNWDQIPELAAHAGGAVVSRDQLNEIAASHAALVNVWIDNGPHAIDALGARVLRRRGNIDTTFINDARQLLSGRAISAPVSVPPLTREMIVKLVC
jgi:hypothetical protein